MCACRETLSQVSFKPSCRKDEPFDLMTTNKRLYSKSKPIQCQYQDLEPCWIWTAYTLYNGYGRFRLNGKTQYSHRVSWEISKGPIPPKICVLHKCDTPACINPDHLFLGTHADNVADKIRKGRGNDGDKNGARTKPASIPRGESRPFSKLSEENIKDIKKLYVRNQFGFKKISKIFDVSPSTIKSIIKQKKWTHVQ